MSKQDKILKDERITLQAKGLYCYCTSVDSITVDNIVSSCKNGKGSVYTVIDELISFGYLERVKYTTEKGHLRYTYKLA
jgi:predicted transcriptional regulator